MFTRTEGRTDGSFTISLHNFVGERIIKLTCLHSSHKTVLSKYPPNIESTKVCLTSLPYSETKKCIYRSKIWTILHSLCIQDTTFFLKLDHQKFPEILLTIAKFCFLTTCHLCINNIQRFYDNIFPHKFQLIPFFIVKMFQRVVNKLFTGCTTSNIYHEHIFKCFVCICCVYTLSQISKIDQGK